MNRLLNDSFKPVRLLCELRYIPPDGGDPIIRNPPKSGSGGGAAKSSAAAPSLITSTGGLFGGAFALLVPFFDLRTNSFVFAIIDPNNFDSEEDCVYNFKMEDVKSGRVVDIHKVYLQYRDLGKVSFDVSVTATQFNRSTQKEKIEVATKTVKVGTTKGDQRIHSYFVDLKVQGERPQLSIVRKKDSGPLSIVTAMLIGNVSEENQL